MNVTCDACLSGGAWEGSFVTSDNFITITGFDDGSDACGNVVATSTELGVSAASEDACAAASIDTEACDLYDCSGQEYCGFESYIGDGYCDDGSWGYYFDCAEFDCDGGDCLDVCGVCNGPGETECWDGSLVCDASACPSECVAGDQNGDGSVNVSDVVLVVNYILIGAPDGATGFECSDMDSNGLINVSDIVQIVNYILGGGTARADNAENIEITASTKSISLDADGFVQGIQLTLSHGTDFSINPVDAYISDYRTIGNQTIVMVVTDGTSSISEIASVSQETMLLKQ